MRKWNRTRYDMAKRMVVGDRGREARDKSECTLSKLSREDMCTCMYMYFSKPLRLL